MQKYLKKKIKDERGVYIAVYAKDPEELERKVAERLAEVERRKALASNPMVWQYAQTWYKLYTAHLSDSRKSDYAIAINRHICPVIGARHMLEVSEDGDHGIDFCLALCAWLREVTPTAGSC